MAATEVHVREEMRGRTATSIASSAAKDREDACGGARGDAEAASLNVGRRRARRWRRAGGRISASMAVVLAVAVLSGNTRGRGTGPVMMAEAYGQSAAVNAVNQLRQNEQRLLEAENTRHRGADGESCTTADDGGAGEHGGVDSDAADGGDVVRGRLTGAKGSEGDKRKSDSGRTMGPIVIIPGFGSSRLRATEEYVCKSGSPGGGTFQPGDDVWLDVARILGPQQSCWMNCISLNTGPGETDVRCRTRPDEGLDAILRLQPGMFTGHPSEVFGSFIGGLVKVGYEPVRDIIALPYDWRLSPMMLQKRDRYFTVMRRMIELMVETHRSPEVPREESRVTLVSHSLGSNVVRYFLDWLKEDIGTNQWQSWIDEHVGTFIAVSAPLLGSPDTVKGVMSGHTFGALPVTMENCRKMGLSFGSSPWMLPVDLRKLQAAASDACPGLDNYRAVVNDTISWPMPILLEFDDDDVPSLNIDDADRFPFGVVANNSMTPGMDDVSGGRYFHGLGEHFDDEFGPFSEKVDAYNEHGVLEPWLERPPFDRVVFAFGTNLQTAISHRWRFRRDYGPMKRWQHLERVYEDKGGAILRSARAASMSAGVGPTTGMSKSGDQVVPYLSLAFGHAWLPDKVNITRVPQRLHSPREVLAVDNVSVREFERNLECTQTGGENCAAGAVQYNTTASPADLYDTFYEARWINPVGRPMHTYIWEFEGQTHRELLRSDIFMRELVAELLWMSSRQKAAQPRLRQVVWEEMIDSASTRRTERTPTNDSQCFWDYWDMGCRPAEYCGYRYKFGDLRLSQSCRLRLREEEAPEAESESCFHEGADTTL